ncbi:MAG: hypothetical protein ACFFBP_15925 [Promethearchaeota archaeon]
MEIIEVEKKNKLSEQERNILKWLKQLKKYRTVVEVSEPKVEVYEPEPTFIKPEKDFETLVREEAYFISLNELSFDELCWLLAERKLSIEKGYSNVSEEDIRKLAEEIHHSGLSYDELCWLNAEVIVIHREHLLN